MRHEEEVLTQMLADVINEYGEREGYSDEAFAEVQRSLRTAAAVLVFKKYVGALERAAVLGQVASDFLECCHRAIGEDYDTLDAANRRQQRNEK